MTSPALDAGSNGVGVNVTGGSTPRASVSFAEHLKALLASTDDSSGDDESNDADAQLSSKQAELSLLWWRVSDKADLSSEELGRLSPACRVVAERQSKLRQRGYKTSDKIDALQAKYEHSQIKQNAFMKALESLEKDHRSRDFELRQNVKRNEALKAETQEDCERMDAEQKQLQDQYDEMCSQNQQSESNVQFLMDHLVRLISGSANVEDHHTQMSDIIANWEERMLMTQKRLKVFKQHVEQVREENRLKAMKVTDAQRLSTSIHETINKKQEEVLMSCLRMAAPREYANEFDQRPYASSTARCRPVVPVGASITPEVPAAAAMVYSPKSEAERVTVAASCVSSKDRAAANVLERCEAPIAATAPAAPTTVMAAAAALLNPAAMLAKAKTSLFGSQENFISNGERPPSPQLPGPALSNRTRGTASTGGNASTNSAASLEAPSLGTEVQSAPSSPAGSPSRCLHLRKEPSRESVNLDVKPSSEHVLGDHRHGSKHSMENPPIVFGALAAPPSHGRRHVCQARGDSSSPLRAVFASGAAGGLGTRSTSQPRNGGVASPTHGGVVNSPASSVGGSRVSPSRSRPNAATPTQSCAPAATVRQGSLQTNLATPSTAVGATRTKSPARGVGQARAKLLSSSEPVPTRSTQSTSYSSLVSSPRSSGRSIRGQPQANPERPPTPGTEGASANARKTGGLTPTQAVQLPNSGTSVGSNGGSIAASAASCEFPAQEAMELKLKEALNAINFGCKVVRFDRSRSEYKFGSEVKAVLKLLSDGSLVASRNGRPFEPINQFLYGVMVNARAGDAAHDRVQGISSATSTPGIGGCGSAASSSARRSASAGPERPIQPNCCPSTPPAQQFHARLPELRVSSSSSSAIPPSLNAAMHGSGVEQRTSVDGLSNDRSTSNARPASATPNSGSTFITTQAAAAAVAGGSAAAAAAFRGQVVAKAQRTSPGPRNGSPVTSSSSLGQTSSSTLHGQSAVHLNSSPRPLMPPMPLGRRAGSSGSASAPGSVAGTPGYATAYGSPSPCGGNPNAPMTSGSYPSLSPAHAGPPVVVSSSWSSPRMPGRTPITGAVGPAFSQATIPVAWSPKKQR